MAQVTKSKIWDEIDLSERYMVCGLFKEASSLASSLIQCLRTSSLEPLQEIELSEIMESAGMVFVQSLKELGRISELFAELKILFGPVEAIPIQVFLSGVCMQVSEGITSNLTAIFEEFLKKWRYADNGVYIFLEDQNCSKCTWQSALNSEEYLEIVEVFVIVLLGRVLRKPELAISWTEKADLPDDKRQDILRRLRSLHLAADSSSAISRTTVQTLERVGEISSRSEEFAKATKSGTHMNGCGSKLASPKTINLSIKCLTHRSNPLWWFSAVRLKFGDIHLVLPGGKIILVGLLMAFASYFFRRKTSELRNFANLEGNSLLLIVHLIHRRPSLHSHAHPQTLDHIWCCFQDS